jgi:hypothetical protein
MKIPRILLLVTAGASGLAGGFIPLTMAQQGPPPLPQQPPPLPVPEIDWYAGVNGQKQGPFKSPIFAEKISRGEITPDTLVWSAGMPDWQPAGKVTQLRRYFGEPVPGQPNPAAGSGGIPNPSTPVQIDEQVDRIVDAELAKHFTETGFKVGPLQIDYDKSPEYQKLETGSLWKRADERKGEAYAAKQKAVNDRLRPEAKAFRADLLGAFEKAAALSGGGSASSFYMNLSAAETEWIIANLDKEEKHDITDSEFLLPLRTNANGLGMPEEYLSEKLKAVIADLHKVEKHLTKGQANFVRKEFLAFFEPRLLDDEVQ